MPDFNQIVNDYTSFYNRLQNKPGLDINVEINGLQTLIQAELTGHGISGTVTGPGGPLANISVFADSDALHVHAQAQTGSGGTYSIAVPAGDYYTISFNDGSGAHPDGCYSAVGFTTDMNACKLVTMGSADVPGTDAVMPLIPVITGTVSGPDGLLANIHVDANADNFGNGNGADTAIDGTYSIAVPSGAYTLQFYDNTGAHVNGCYDSNNSPSYFTTNQGACTPVDVAGSDVGGKDVQMPLGVAITGPVRGPDGQGLPNININAGNFGFGAQTNDVGYYSLTVPPNGDYTLQFNDNNGPHLSGCYSSSSPGNFTTDQQHGCTPVSSGSDGASGINVSMPLGVAITGTVRGPDGQGLPNININAGNFGFGAQTNDVGYYSLTVPPNGDYTLQFNDNNGPHLSGCYSSSSPGNFTTDQQHGCTPVSSGSDGASGINVSMPLGVAITGTVRGPDGQGLPNININAGNFGFGAQTNDVGYYSLTVPPNGDYTLQFNDNNGPHL